jgi:segregation and condensation protein B
VDGTPDRSAILEALLFVAEEPLPLPKLQEILGDADPAQTEASVRDLAVRLEADGRGVTVQEVGGGYRLATTPDVHPWVQRLQQVKPARLSRAALETLAIIAYRQPITRAEIEAIRGVAVDGVLRTLLERELVRMMGRKAEAGRPMLYGTSQQFLEHFGLRDLADLPTLREIHELIGTTETGTDSAGASVEPHPRQPERGQDTAASPTASGNGAPEGRGVAESSPDAGEPTEADHEGARAAGAAGSGGGLPG